jgi:alcohol dehydrogenase class IV
MKTLTARIRHYIFRVVTRILVFPEPVTITGPGSLKKIPELLLEKDIKKILVVTDADLVKIGLIDKLLKALTIENIEYVIYSEVKPNPTIKNVEDGLKVYRSNNCSAVIAFGGGSPIDCAKIIAAKTTNKKPIRKMKGLFKVWHKLPLLIAVPTTAGTGSEATIVAVISDPDNREKFAINSPNLTPSACILDPELLVGLPKQLTSTTGMDALTHAIEAYIGLIGSPYTNELALKATKLVFEHLERSYHDGSNIESREAMLLASHYAGKAFTRAYVGYVHAVAHNLGGYYGVPHGLGNAVVLPQILELSKNKWSINKMAELARYAGLGSLEDNEDRLCDKFIEKIKSMNSNMDIPTGFSEIVDSDIPELARRIEEEGNPTYPVPKLLWQKDFENLLHQLKA